MTRNPKITPTSEQPGTVAPITVSPISGAMTRARNDAEIVASWLDGMHSAHTRAAFAMTADRFMAQLAARDLTLRTLTVEDAREIVVAIGMGMAPSTAAQYAARIKSLLGYAHRIGYAPFNAGAAIRIKGGKVDRAKRIVGETEVALLIRAAPTRRDRLLLEVGYAGGLRVSELVALRWADVLVLDGDRVQLSVTGKGDKLRHILLPAIVSRTLLAFRGEAGPDDPVFPSRKGGGLLYPRAVNRMLKVAAERAGVNPAVSAHWLRHAHASHALTRGATVAEVAETLGHASIATTSVYLHAHPDRSSGLVLDDGVFLR